MQAEEPKLVQIGEETVGQRSDVVVVQVQYFETRVEAGERIHFDSRQTDALLENNSQSVGVYYLCTKRWLLTENDGLSSKNIVTT